MNKKHYILVLLIILVFDLFSQTRVKKIDSLLVKANTEKTDSSRSYWNDLVAKEYLNTNLDSGIYYATLALDFAKKAKKQEYIVDAYNSLGMLYREKGDFDKSLENLNNALEIINKYKISKWYLERIYSSLNLTYTEQGNYTAGIEYGFKSLHEIEKSGDTMSIAMANNNLGNAFFNLKQLEKAMKHYKVALIYADKLKHVYGQSLLNGNIGSVYYEMGKYDSAKIYYDKSLKLCILVEDIVGEAIAYGNIGSYYQVKHDNTKAIEYFSKAIEIFKNFDMKPNLCDMYYNMATSYIDLKDYTKALQFGDKALQLAEQIKSYPHIQQAHLTLKNTYDKLNNIPKAYYHYQQYITAKDSIFNEENRKEQFKSEIVYEYNKKRYADSLNQQLIAKMQLEELNHEKEKNETQKKLTTAAVAGFAIMLLFAIFIFKGYRDKKNANKIIAFQKDLVEAKQKEIIDSIHYAKRIQQSLLPSEKYIQRNLKK